MKTFNSEAAAAIHEMAQGMFNNNLLSSEEMQQVEELCVTSTPDQFPSHQNGEQQAVGSRFEQQNSTTAPYKER